MSYNGIGLQTAKGSSTNGYIQKNYTRSYQTNYKKRLQNKQDDEKRDRLVQVVQDKELIKHENRRKIELKVSEYRDKLEDDGLEDAEIDKKCETYRESLLQPKKLDYKPRDKIEEKPEKVEIQELDY